MKNTRFLLIAFFLTLNFTFLNTSCKQIGNKIIHETQKLSDPNSIQSNDDDNNNTTTPIDNSDKDLTDPINYNDKLIKYYSTLDDQIAVFENAIWDDDVNLDKLQKEYDITLKIYNDNYDNLKEIQTLRNDKGFLSAVIDFYDKVNDALNNEYKEILELEATTDDDAMDKITNIDNKIVDELVDAENTVIDGQKIFADANGITLY